MRIAPCRPMCVGLLCAGALAGCTEAAPRRGVVVAAHALAAGTELGPRDLAVVQVTSAPPAGLLLPEDAGPLVGRRLLVDLAAGDPLSEAALVLPSPRQALPIGARTVSIPLAGAEHLLPGDRIDVLVTVPEPESGGLQTVQLVEDVSVGAVAPFEPAVAGAREPANRLVTLVVVQGEAELLIEGMNLGALHAALRNPQDPATLDESPRATLSALRSDERQRMLYSRRAPQPLPRRPTPPEPSR